MPTWIDPPDNVTPGATGHDAAHDEISDDLAFIATAFPGVQTGQATTAHNTLDDGSGNATIAGTTTVNGLVTTARLVTSNYTALASDSMIFANATSGGLTVTLPTASGNAGRHYVVIQTDSSGNVVTVLPAGGLIDGNSGGFLLAGQYQGIGLVSDGTNWQIDAFPITAGFQVFDGGKQFQGFVYLTGGAQIKGFCPQITTQTSNYTASDNDVTVLANGASTITLPSAGGVLNAGQTFTVKQIHTGSCTVATGGGNIDGASTYSLSAQYKYVTVVSDGTNWYVIGNN